MLQSVVSKSSRHAVQSKAFRAVSSSSFAALKKELTQSGNTKDPTSSVTGVAAFFFLIFLFFFLQLHRHVSVHMTQRGPPPSRHCEGKETEGVPWNKAPTDYGSRFQTFSSGVVRLAQGRPRQAVIGGRLKCLDVLTRRWKCLSGEGEKGNL